MSKRNKHVLSETIKVPVSWYPEGFKVVELKVLKPLAREKTRTVGDKVYRWEDRIIVAHARRKALYVLLELDELIDILSDLRSEMERIMPDVLRETNRLIHLGRFSTVMDVADFMIRRLGKPILIMLEQLKHIKDKAERTLA